jgi:GNAT superfamily N-acetyltransferase
MQTVYVEGGFVRKLWDVETDAYRDHLLRLDSESRHNRFSGSVADEAIRSFAGAVHGPDVIIHGFFVDGVLRGAADLHMVMPGNLREAEAAFSIEKPWQSRGVGSALLGRTLLCARNRGVKHLLVSCLPQNRQMQQLARKFEAIFAFDYDTVVGTIDSPDPTPLSVAQEFFVDGYSAAAAYVDFQSRILRPAAAFVRPLSYPSALRVS